MTTNITYNQLYSDMAKCFSVRRGGEEYKLGDYMRMRAKAKCAKKEVKPEEAKHSALPILATVKTQAPIVISSFFSYVNDKLTVKNAPVRDKTIRRFPLRTSLTALCSAFLVCALTVCYGLIGLRSASSEEFVSENTEIPTEEAVEYVESLESFDNL